MVRVVIVVMVVLVAPSQFAPRFASAPVASPPQLATNHPFSTLLHNHHFTVLLYPISPLFRHDAPRVAGICRSIHASRDNHNHSLQCQPSPKRPSRQLEASDWTASLPMKFRADVIAYHDSWTGNQLATTDLQRQQSRNRSIPSDRIPLIEYLDPPVPLSARHQVHHAGHHCPGLATGSTSGTLVHGKYP
jgi:hypothetical protein